MHTEQLGLCRTTCDQLDIAVWQLFILSLKLAILKC